MPNDCMHAYKYGCFYSVVLVCCIYIWLPLKNSKSKSTKSKHNRVYLYWVNSTVLKERDFLCSVRRNDTAYVLSCCFYYILNIVVYSTTFSDTYHSIVCVFLSLSAKEQSHWTRSVNGCHTYIDITIPCISLFFTIAQG